MKLTRCIQKNMKILARSKGSALVVLLAPLIIVFIIGLGFMDNQEIKLNIGIHEKEPTELTARYVQAFNTSENNIIKYETEQQCINSIRDGITVMCAIFSEDFEIKDDAKNEIIFHVDESRINLVDKLVSSFSVSLGTESSEISQELAHQLLQILELTNKESKESLALIITNKAQLTKATTVSGTAQTTITGLDTTKETINTKTIENRISDAESDYVSLRTKARDAVKKANDLLSEIPDSSEKTALETSINNLNTTAENSNPLSNLDDLQKAIKSLSTSISKLSARIDKAGTAKTTITNNLNELQTTIDDLTKNTDDLKTKQEKIITEIESFELRSARSISSPITTKIESVTSLNNRLTYSFSYLLTLAILFIGLMLSSTLVYMEKDSKAFFRNFTTPTTQKYFTLVNYLTALIIIVIQTALILAIAQYTLNVPLLSNILVTSIILFVGITLFISLGLLIGTLSSTSEAVTMSTIVIGSVFLFLSNLVLPLETLSPIISKIAGFNPYVIVSESIRKAMLFQADLSQVYPEIIMLIAYTAIILTLMIIINQLGFKHFLASRRHKKNMIITEPDNLVIEINNQAKRIKNIPELIEILKKIQPKEYQELTKKENPISDWLKTNLKKIMLARRIKKKKLSEVIKILEKYQEKKDKKQNKKDKK